MATPKTNHYSEVFRFAVSPKELIWTTIVSPKVKLSGVDWTAKFGKSTGDGNDNNNNFLSVYLAYLISQVAIPSKMFQVQPSNYLPSYTRQWSRFYRCKHLMMKIPLVESTNSSGPSFWGIMC